MKGKLVTPKTFLVGFSSLYSEGLVEYLKYTGNEEFIDSVIEATKQGLADGEIMASLYAKICYKSLSLGKNSNITKVRDIPDNLVGCFAAGHGSVFGHSMINFISTDVSRVFTHELVRNHIGTEYSQTSGRYCRLDQIDLIMDPILKGCEEIIQNAVGTLEESVYLIECKKNLRVPPDLPEYLAGYQESVNNSPSFYKAPALSAEHREKMRWVPNNKLDFTYKKKVTSAARRIAPNGQANEIGWSINLRALRHVIQMRTSRHAEWEIRLVMSQVYELVKAKFPLIFHGAKIRIVDGLPEIYNMKTQPYALSEEETLKAVTTDQLMDEMSLRQQGK